MPIGVIYLVVLYVTILMGCSSTPKSNKIIVAAAASTQYVLDELIELYQKDQAVRIESIISSSGKLTAQIEQGAPVDIFISADTTYPNYLAQKGLGVEQPVVYASGKLIVWTYADLNLSGGLNILTDPSIQKITIADPKTAPYGLLSQQILNDKKIYNSIQSKLVLGESVGQVNQYITTQAVTLGLTAKSVVMAPNLKQKGHFWEIPNYALEQSMLLIKRENPSGVALNFYQFLQSKAAKLIFEKHGYAVQPN
ncbi:molybdate ABC transporter substrate-binding protein [Aureispira anguillae]|nr:molybdate ABC transporter substrate-binding protein [Aureispira anguillae]